MSTFTQSLVLALGLVTVAGPAAAADSPTSRVVTGVGHWIAAQGNQALRDVREELKDQLADTLAPLMQKQDQDRDEGRAQPAPATTH